MTAVTSTYLLFAPEGFSLPATISYPAGILISLAALTAFFIYQRSLQKMFSETIITKKSIFKTDLTK